MTRSGVRRSTLLAGPAGATVLAAGGLLWRGEKSELEVALVHRPKYDDWALPKGKVDPGEQLVVTARREVAEETGAVAVCGRTVGEQRYRVAAGDKYIRYWAMTPQDPDSGFTPGAEIDALEWLAPAEASRRLSYNHDRKLLNAFTKGPRRTTTMLIVRHGRAGDKHRWKHDDRLRPLDDDGRAQAELLRAVVPCYAPRGCISAEPNRCVQTVWPAAADLGLSVHTEPLLGNASYAADPEASVRWLREVAVGNEPMLLCSQGEVIPDLIRRVARGSGVQLRRIRATKGSLWALSFVGAQLVDADYFADLRPVVPSLGVG